MSYNYSKLLELADCLDKKGLKQEADLVDRILKNAGYEVGEIGGYEEFMRLIDEFIDKHLDETKKQRYSVVRAIIAKIIKTLF